MPAFGKDTRLVSDISKGRSLRIIEHIKRVELGNEAHIHFTYSVHTLRVNVNSTSSGFGSSSPAILEAGSRIL